MTDRTEVAWGLAGGVFYENTQHLLSCLIRENLSTKLCRRDCWVVVCDSFRIRRVCFCLANSDTMFGVCNVGKLVS